MRSDDQLEVMKRIWGMPTMEIHGVVGGYQGPGVKSIVPPRAEVKASFRLVPGQDPNAGARKVNPADVSVKWFNVNAFQAAANGTIGNVGRNTIHGPGYANLDASIAKNFPITESARVKFQAEFYNFTNSVNFLVDNPGSSPNSFLMQNRTHSRM